MKIVLTGKDPWRVQGVALVLEQAGIPFCFETGADTADILIADELTTLPAGACGISVGPFREGTTRPEGNFDFEGCRIHCPMTTVIPTLPSDAERLAAFADGSPAVFRRGHTFYVLPDLFGYIARNSTLRCFSRTFAESFSWDGLREMLIRLLEMCADRLSKPLLRLWYYPTMRYRNSLTFTVDVDHKLAWEIVRRVGRFTRTKAAASRLMPTWAKNLPAMSAYARYHNTRIPDCHLTPARSFWARACGRLGLRLSAAFYPASMARILASGIPITVFLRPSARQLEERMDPPPLGTGRAGYAPEAVAGMEMGLHFGATVGSADGGIDIANPYEADVFGADIARQKELLEREIGQPTVGTRLHHIYGFNQAMFLHLDRMGILYDSSIFGSAGGAETAVSPVGTTLPYRPVLEEDGRLRGAAYVELPVSVYEMERLPFDRFCANHSTIILSEHPDRTASHQIDEVLKALPRHREACWPVTLRQLAEWWQRRRTTTLAVEEGAIRISPPDGSGGALCLVVYPAAFQPRFESGVQVLADGVADGNHRFLDVTTL